MSKRVSFVNLKEESLQALSAWNQANKALQMARVSFKTEKATVEALIGDIERARAEKSAEGYTSAEVDRMDGMSTAGLRDRLTKAQSVYDDVKKEYRHEEARAMIALGLWLTDAKGKVTTVPVGSAYANFVARGSFDGLVKATKPALDALQAGNVDANTTGKFCKYCLQVAERGKATAKDTANGHFVRTYAEISAQKRFAVAFARGILEYLVNVAKVVTVNNDGSLARKVYAPAEPSEEASADAEVKVA